MEQKSLWTVGGILLCAAVGGILIWHHLSQSPSYTPPAQEPPGKGVVGNVKLNKDSYDTLITYTDSGFTPSDITIAQGTRVRFLNNSAQEIWPASGIHPTHTLYPEKESGDCLGSSFDSCTTLAKGEFYDFTFYYVGAWPYHDHLHAYQTGTITVTAK